MKEDYIDTAALDDKNLLMQYFKKHDTDGNMKLDGLELLKAISKMEGKFYMLISNKYGTVQELRSTFSQIKSNIVL